MLNETPMRLALITSRFNDTITNRLYQGAVEQCQQSHIILTDTDSAWVPGAVEIPLIAQQYAALKQWDAIICLGSIIRGETNHYDLVCQQVSQGCQQVSLQYNLPVIFGILTRTTHPTPQHREYQ